MRDIDMNDEYKDFDLPLVQAIDNTMSPTIGKLAGALAKAQGAMHGAIKDSNNPFFKSQYADLASVIESGREALSSNGLAVIQTTEWCESGVTVVSTLAHESGEWIRGKLHMKPVKNDPQGLGSCMTYARRYSYAALIGIAAIDDDGNAASDVAGNKKKIKPTPDPEAVSLLKSADNLDTLADIWKDLTHDQRLSIGKEGLDKFKSALK